MPTQELPQSPSAVEPFIFHLAHRQSIAEKRPPAPLRRYIPGTGEGALAGMIIFTLCLAGTVNAAIHLGWEGFYAWLMAILLAAVDGSLLWVMIRLVRQENHAKRLFDKGQTLRGGLVSCAGYEQPSPPPSWESSSGSSVYVVSLTYSFRTPDGREIVKREQWCSDERRGKPLPEPGTPVLVQYLDDEQYEML